MVLNFVSSSLSVFYFLNSRNHVVVDLNPFNSVNQSFNLLLIADSVSLSCSSGLKEFKILTF